ncbi:MAG: hypothetical protein LC641_05655 [Spirochaeta sp.]|nr:hypothetical protein [Spirochaeta sp.]
MRCTRQLARAALCSLISGMLALTYASCSNEVSGSTPSEIRNPLIQTNDFFPGSNWNDPHVIHDGTQFVMYASASQNFDFDIKIYRLISSNGIDWNLSPTYAVMEKSAVGWDSKSVETPAVVFFDGQYHMFYTGYDDVFTATEDYKVGHATSPDGIVWERIGVVLEPTAPDADPNLDFNQFLVADAPVVFDDKIYLYFTAVGANNGVGTTLQVIGLTIFDGDSWTAPESVLEPDQALFPRSAFYGYSTPNALVQGGQVHLFFSVVTDVPWKQVRIHRAVSSDGSTGWVHDSQSLLRKEDFSWTSDEIRSALRFVEVMLPTAIRRQRARACQGI